MRKETILGIEYTARNQREESFLRLLKQTIEHLHCLLDYNYMKEWADSKGLEWSRQDNESAINRNINEINGLLLACYYLNMIPSSKSYSSKYEFKELDF